MYDTRPDLQSYVFAFRRLWWFPIILAVVSSLLVVGAMSSEQMGVSAVLQVPDSGSLAAVARVSVLYDSRSEAASLARELNASDRIDGLSAEAEASQNSIGISFTVNSEKDVKARIEEVNALIATTWATVMGSTLAPAREWAAMTSDQLSEQLESLRDVRGDDAALERARLAGLLSDAKVIGAAMDDVASSPPKLSGLSTSPVSTKSSRLRLGGPAGLFIGIGAVLAFAALDKRVRRRSILERNGLTVVAVSDTQGSNLGSVSAGLLSAAESSLKSVVVVRVGSETDTSGLVRTLGSDPQIESVNEVVQEDRVGPDFIDSVRSSDAVVLVIGFGGSDYTSVLEIARTAVTTGARNVCCVILVGHRRSMAEALS